MSGAQISNGSAAISGDTTDHAVAIYYRDAVAITVGVAIRVYLRGCYRGIL